MKAVQIRRLVDLFLRLRREREIDAQYERAFAAIEDPLGTEFEGWEEEGVWPPEGPRREV